MLPLLSLTSEMVQVFFGAAAELVLEDAVEEVEDAAALEVVEALEVVLDFAVLEVLLPEVAAADLLALLDGTTKPVALAE